MTAELYTDSAAYQQALDDIMEETSRDLRSDLRYYFGTFALRNMTDADIEILLRPLQTAINRITQKVEGHYITQAAAEAERHSLQLLEVAFAVNRKSKSGEE